MTTEQAAALVTGANKGLGLKTCRQLARRAITVLMVGTCIRLAATQIDG